MAEQAADPAGAPRPETQHLLLPAAPATWTTDETRYAAATYPKDARCVAPPAAAATPPSQR